jgi:hypothetical protein
LEPKFDDEPDRDSGSVYTFVRDGERWDAVYPFLRKDGKWVEQKKLSSQGVKTNEGHNIGTGNRFEAPSLRLMTEFGTGDKQYRPWTSHHALLK